MQKFKKKELSSWNGLFKSENNIFVPKNKKQILEIIEYAKKNKLSINTVGAKNTFGDMILNRDNITLDLKFFNKIININTLKCECIVEGGVNFKSLIQHLKQKNLIPFSIPGAINSTLAGCVANNVHGKDFLFGNIGQSVNFIELITSSGDTLEVSRENHRDLFLATVGGMGLTGIITKVGLNLKKIKSNFLSTNKIITKNLKATLLNTLDQCKEENDFCQTWFDLSIEGKNLGRGVIMTAKFINVNADEIKPSSTFFKKYKDFLLKFIYKNFSFLFFYPFIKYVNYIYWNLNSVHKYFLKSLVDFEDYYFFHKNNSNFYSVYKKRGFVSFQIVFTEKPIEKIFKFLDFLRENAIFSTLSGVKKMSSDEFLISFEGDGLSISIDIPIKGNNIENINTQMNLIYGKILDLDGKVNLSKDSFISKKIFEKMYKNYHKFWEIKKRIDPTLTFSNQKARKLFNF